MRQKIKNFLKRILPPPMRVFQREITRVLNAIAGVQKAIKTSREQTLSELQKNQQQLLSELASTRKQQEHILSELAGTRKQQEHILSELACIRKQQDHANTELKQQEQLVIDLYQKLSQQTLQNAQSINLLAQDTSVVKQLVENQGEELSVQVQRQGHRVIQKIDRIERRNKNLPVISVLIPVYNVESYLRQCLDSVVNQSLKNIEIICVNDGSTDGSGRILDEYASNDPRIKVIHKLDNEGLLLARKTAVECATGQYLLFVDSDDLIDLNLCAFAEEITKTEYADIIQFGAGVCDYSNNEKKVSWLRRALMPSDKRFSDSKVLTEAYVSRSYVTSLWGKLYKTELCKKAYADLPDTHCYVGEDIFTYFFLAHHAQSYKAIPTRAYYTYRHGLGVTNTETMPLEKFELYCSMAYFDRYIYDRLICESNDQSLQDSYTGMIRRLATDCCNIYAYRMQEQDKEAALKILVSHWADNDIADDVAQKILGFSLRQRLQ